ncbi:MAG: hypothetical protein HY321_07255 [Armatimonadetes bacterium]|nr:hypothetical protein [Armatimonadota bacterium]
MQVQALKLQDVQFGNQWFDEVLDHWGYDQMKADPAWRKGWVSFDSALYRPEDDRVYLGITSFDADIFKAYDRATGRFVDLGYARVADPFDAKFHRSLVRGRDGRLYAAIALLHDVDRYLEAPGGAIVQYDPESGGISKLCVPMPHTYIQSIALDLEREVLYCLGFPPEKLAAFHLRTGEVRELGIIGTYGEFAQGENIVLDDNGGLWCNWSLTRAWQSAPGVDALRLCRYDPDQGKIKFFPIGLPRPDGAYGTVKAEAFFNFHDGFLYASGANGSLFRIDPETAKAEHLFTPTPDRPSRLSSMVKAEEGFAYGVTGREGRCELMRVDYRKATFEKLGEIRDQDGTVLWQCHDLVLTNDGVLYICENDNPYRSSYLWEVKP